MNILSVDDVPTGYRVSIEIPNAYADGTSRIETYTLTHADVIDKTPEQIRQRIRDVIAGKSLAEEATLANVEAPLPAPVDTRSKLEALARENVLNWRDWQWRIDHIDDYGLAAGQRTVLLNAATARRDNCVARDLKLMQRWRVAIDDTP